MKRNENASHLKRPSDRNPPRRGGPRPPPPPLPLAFEEAFSSKGCSPQSWFWRPRTNVSQSLVCRRRRRFFFVVFFLFFSFFFFFETEKFFEKKKILFLFARHKKTTKRRRRRQETSGRSLMSRGGGAETGGLLLSGGPFRSAFEFGCATPNERHPLFLLRVSLLSFLFRFREEVRGSFLSQCARVLLFFVGSLLFFGGFY